MNDWTKVRGSVTNHQTQLREDLEKLAKDLKAHDWNAGYSEDRSVVYNAQRERQSLWARAQSLGPQGTALFSQMHKRYSA